MSSKRPFVVTEHALLVNGTRDLTVFVSPDLTEGQRKEIEDRLNSRFEALWEHMEATFGPVDAVRARALVASFMEHVVLPACAEKASGETA